MNDATPFLFLLKLLTASNIAEMKDSNPTKSSKGTNMRVLITGSSGQVGATIASELSLSYEVVGLDLAPGRWTTIQGSVTDPRCLTKALSGVDTVIHTAALHAPHVGRRSQREFVATNVHGTERLLEAALKNRIQRFIYTSTTSLYGNALLPKGKSVWVTETLTPIPRDIYDETKIAAENLCATASQAGLPCLSLRISRCFPEPESLLAIYRLYRGVDLRDVAHAHCLSLCADISGFAVFNISSASSFREDETEALLRDAPTVIERHFPWARAAFHRRGWRLPETIDRVYVIEKAKRLLGYAPKYNFKTLFDDLSNDQLKIRKAVGVDNVLGTT